MYIELQDILIVGLFLGAALCWWQWQAVKEVALQATKQHCQQIDVQLLDDSVVLRGLHPVRDSAGGLCLRRSYLFEFTTTGEQRYHGCTVMLGRKVESIQLAPHRLN